MSGISKRIGTVGALFLSYSDLPLPDITVHPGVMNETISSRRLFSVGSVTIGNYIIKDAKFIWDTGSKQTFVYVPSYDVIGIPCVDTFSVSGIGADVKARAYPAKITLSKDLYIDELIAGVLIGDDNPEDDSFESADVILGMDVLRLGRLLVDGPSGRFTFEIK